MRALLALLAAVAMVVAAVAIRARLDGGDPEGTPTPGGAVRIVCASELAAACGEISGRASTSVEPAGVTAERLASVGAGVDPGLDGWLVPNPWPELVNERRRTRSLPPLLAVDGPPLARSPLRLAVSRARADALRPKCPGKVTWKCLGDAAADGYWLSAGQPQWGLIKPGHADAGTDAIGLLVLGQAVSSYFGRSDLVTIDLDTDDGFQRWFSALERQMPAPPPGSSPLSQMLLTNTAAYDAVGTIEAEAIRVVTGPDDPRVDLLYPEPMATADAVLATTGTTAARSAKRAAGGDATRKALATSGWWAPGPPASRLTAPSLPPGNGLPSGGLLLQLQDRWHAVTGR